jgi:cellulose synthase/poly-beta-1,6-N-acetylglucosamine synthase-like glycosyltransferase
MHNEAAVAMGILQALAAADYPKDLLEIIPINDHSIDGTKEILDGFAARHPYVRPLHRDGKTRGKQAALNEALTIAKHDIIIVFDADYTPQQSALRDLAVSFKDPEVGAVMGRVVPQNAGHNLLTRLLDLERSGGYQVDQQARHNYGLVPQYGGTIGGFRKKIVQDMGGFDPTVLAEDTDLTFLLYIHGWKVAYANRVECYEEAPENWATRSTQIYRWSRGHNHVMIKNFGGLLRSRYLRRIERLDGALLLALYLIPFFMLTGFIDSLILFFLGEMQIIDSILVFFFVAGYNAFGNFAPFFQIGSAALLDGTTRRLRLLPFLLFYFILNVWTINMGLFAAVWDRATKRQVMWAKTERYKRSRLEAES